MPIKNYSTKVDAAKTCGEITGLLAGKGAKRVQIDYDDQNFHKLTNSEILEVIH